MSGQDTVRAAVAELTYLELDDLAGLLSRRGDREDRKRLIAVLAGWAGWQPPRAAKVNPFPLPDRVA